MNKFIIEYGKQNRVMGYLIAIKDVQDIAYDSINKTTNPETMTALKRVMAKLVGLSKESQQRLEKEKSAAERAEEN